MDTVSSIAQSIEAKVGVGGGAAQALAWVAVLLVTYLAWQVVQGLIFGGVLKKKRQLGQKVLIFGQNGAGKTSLFFRLRDGADGEVTTVSSLTPLRDTLKIQPSEDEVIGPVEVVDYPGHLRYRGKSADMIKEARCIVYVVDAEDKQRLKDVAEHLYELLTHQDVCELHTPMIIAMNKVELTAARSEKYIIEEIEREIEQMRFTRGATLEGQDQADSYLGVDGEKFKLLEHSPCPISMCRISVKKPQLDPLYDFLRQQFA